MLTNAHGLTRADRKVFTERTRSDLFAKPKLCKLTVARQ